WSLLVHHGAWLSKRCSPWQDHLQEAADSQASEKSQSEAALAARRVGRTCEEPPRIHHGQPLYAIQRAGVKGAQARSDEQASWPILGPCEASPPGRFRPQPGAASPAGCYPTLPS